MTSIIEVEESKTFQNDQDFKLIKENNSENDDEKNEVIDILSAIDGQTSELGDNYTAVGYEKKNSDDLVYSNSKYFNIQNEEHKNKSEKERYDDINIEVNEEIDLLQNVESGNSYIKKGKPRSKSFDEKTCRNVLNEYCGTKEGGGIKNPKEKIIDEKYNMIHEKKGKEKLYLSEKNYVIKPNIGTIMSRKIHNSEEENNIILKEEKREKILHENDVDKPKNFLTIRAVTDTYVTNLYKPKTQEIYYHDEEKVEFLNCIRYLTEERDTLLEQNSDMLQQLRSIFLHFAEENISDQLPFSLLINKIQKIISEEKKQRVISTKKIQEMKKQIEDNNVKLQFYSKMELEMEATKLKIIQVSDEENKLLDVCDNHERKEVLLQNRLNEAKKKEANLMNTVQTLQENNEEWKNKNKEIQETVHNVRKSNVKLERSMEKLKKKCIDRVKRSENMFQEEQTLNEERKIKMKEFIEKKADELREAKEGTIEKTVELNNTNAALDSLRMKVENITTALVQSQERNRDLAVEITRIKKTSEQLHQHENDLEFELYRSEKETEEHKSKRLSARQELLTMLKNFEAEQAVNARLKDKVKFTFTPKAISQQELMVEALEQFEIELVKLSKRLHMSLPPRSIDGTVKQIHEDVDNTITPVKNELQMKVSTRMDWDISRLLYNLDEETQRVSQKIMILVDSIERMRILLDNTDERSCVSVFQDFLMFTSMPRQ